MLHRLRRHPFSVEAHFRHSLVLTYAYRPEVLSPLLPPGLLVDTRGLRPSWLPPALGQDFFLSGYRIFARLKTQAGRTLRGLRILRSDADRRLMVTSGNLFTHYRYRKCDAELREAGERLEVRVRTPSAEADLEVSADLHAHPDAQPAGSPFRDLREARMFAGPLPFTFDYEPETHSIVVIEG